MMNTNKNITDTTENESNIGKIENEGQVVDNKDGEKEDKVTSNNQSKTLVAYYSAQTHTKVVAEKIDKNLNADIFEIEPEEKYTSEDLNWTNNNSRVSREHNDESLRDVKLLKDKVENWEDGHRFNERPSDSDIKKWTDSLK